MRIIWPSLTLINMFQRKTTRGSFHSELQFGCCNLAELYVVGLEREPFRRLRLGEGIAHVSYIEVSCVLILFFKATLESRIGMVKC